MSYREPDDASKRAVAASERLAKLASAGERKRRALASVKNQEALAASEKERAERQHFTRVAATRASLLANPWFFGFAAPCVAGIALAGLHVNSLVGWVAFSVGLMVASYVLGLALADRAVEREHAWASDLPFELPGYFDALAKEMAIGVSVTLTFEGEPPPAELVANVVAAFDGEAKVDGSITRPFLCLAGTGAIRRWLHRLVAEVLLPLHAAHPLAKVQVEASPPGD